MEKKLNLNDEPQNVVVKPSEKRNDEPQNVVVKPSEKIVELTPVKLGKEVKITEEKRNK